MIYVYALADPRDALPSDASGFGEAPLETLAVQGVGAVFSTCEAPPTPDAENLWRHETVAGALMRGGPVLPARFGTTLAGPPRLRTVLARNHAVVRAGLEHVRGCVEVGVRVLDGRAGERQPDEPGELPEEGIAEPAADGEAPRGGAGRAYLLRRVAEERRRRGAAPDVEAVAQDVHVPLARRARDAVRRPARGAGVLVAAYLVDRVQLDGFVAAVRDLDGERADRRVVCTGPWAPYSFAPSLELEGSLDD